MTYNIYRGLLTYLLSPPDPPSRASGWGRRFRISDLEITDDASSLREKQGLRFRISRLGFGHSFLGGWGL